MYDNQSNESTSNAAAYVLFTVFVVVAGIVLFPFLAQFGSTSGTHRSSCLSNVKQLTLGSIMYGADYNDTVMLREGWSDLLVPYVKSNRLYKCTILLKAPQEVQGYAFNSNLAGISYASIKSPDAKPILYDSLNLAWNASDPFSSVPDPGRHKTVNMVGFVDGHAKAFKPAASASLDPRAR